MSKKWGGSIVMPYGKINFRSTVHVISGGELAHSIISIILLYLEDKI